MSCPVQLDGGKTRWFSRQKTTIGWASILPGFRTLELSLVELMAGMASVVVMLCAMSRLRLVVQIVGRRDVLTSRLIFGLLDLWNCLFKLLEFILSKNSLNPYFANVYNHFTSYTT